MMKRIWYLSAFFMIFSVLGACSSSTSSTDQPRAKAGDGIGSTAKERAGLHFGSGKGGVVETIASDGTRIYTYGEADVCSPDTSITLNKQEGPPADQQACGVIETLASGVELYFYKGIQYAASTAEDNRWVDPKPPTWQSLSAYEYGPICPQGKGHEISTSGVNEDCLYLNVWTPKITPEGDGDLPVMVFIHGGAFIMGSGGSDAGDMPGKLNLYDGARFVETSMMDGGDSIVFVTMNYRLGVLGFLAGNEIGLDGNFGIKDQTAALQWVQKNISLFGGDPDHVMIFGESAGAQSTALHLTITHDDHQSLFDNAVLESNYAIQYMDLESAQQKADVFEKHMKCSDLPTEAARLLCLRGMPLSTVLYHQLLGAYSVTNLKCSGLQAFIPWNPVIDGTFITQDPISGTIDKPMMNGTTLSESIPFVAKLPDNDLISGIAYDALMDFLFLDKTPSAGAIKAHYAEQYPRYGQKELFEQVVTDYLWTCFNRHLSGVPEGTPVYRYHDIHHGSFSTWVNKEGEVKGAIPVACAASPGVCHADELPFVFGNATDNARIQRTFTKDEADMSRALREFWINFARNSDPNPSSNPDWWPLNTEGGDILEIQAPGSEIKSVTDASLTDPANCNEIWDKIGYIVTSIYTCEDF